MMTYLQWILLTLLTGNPFLAAGILLVVWLVADRFTVRVLPDPFRVLRRLGRERQLDRTLANNPHDGRARLELAGLLVERRAYRRAMEVLRPNLDAGDDDVQTLFTMGAACLGAGYPSQGEALLAAAKEKDHDFRAGEIDLVLGRFRLLRGDFAGARDALTTLVETRKGSVEGRVLLARALAGLGDDGAAALMRDEAWHEFAAAPRFQKRLQRRWAWQARPTRPLAYGLVLVLLLAMCGVAVRDGEVLSSAATPAFIDDGR